MEKDKNVVRFPDIGSVEAEAAAWVARLDGEDCTAEDRAGFLEWLNRSALHREVGTRMFSLWSDFDQLQKIVPHQRAENAPKTQTAWSLAQLWHGVIAIPAWSLVPVAAVLVLAVGLTTVFHFAPMWRYQPETQYYQTAIGNQKTVKLSDGTTVQINTDSKIELHYTRTRRTVRLLRGEAFFEIADHDSRPFTVLSGDQIVRDIGTAFAVRMVDQAVEVTVMRGAVELTAMPDSDEPADQAPRHKKVIRQGHNALFDREIVYVKPVSKTEMKRQLAWRRGYLEYSGEPLAQVVADVSRYTHLRIDVADAKIKTIPVGGYFAIDKLDTVFVALEKNFGIRAEWQDATHVRLVAADDGQEKRSTPQ